MAISILCGLLFVYAAIAVPVPGDVPKDINPVNDSISLFLQKSEDLYVYDDNGNPVKIDFSADYPETLEQTTKNLRRRVQFLLHTRQSPENPQRLYIDDITGLNTSFFEKKKETKFVTHGWIGSRRSNACVLTRKAYLQHGDYNVFVVDWSSISKRPYIWSSNRVLLISQYVSKMIDFLVSQGQNAGLITTVGHSLGGHVAGLSAHYSKHKIQQAIGLDPALPNFSKAGPGNRIARGDASYVQIIHTNAGLLGYSASIGDIDFFPNGGRKQDGCNVDIGGACSHARSVEYFAESINSRVGFYSKHCGSYEEYNAGRCTAESSVLMGGVTPLVNVHGNFYLKTNKQSPFAMGRV